jgi:hypothetical protein
MKFRKGFGLILVIVVIAGLSTNCNKENNNPAVPGDTTQVTYILRNYVRAYLDISGKITAYEYLDSLGNITSATQILYSGSIISQISGDWPIRKYYLNSNGFVEYIIDSSLVQLDTVAEMKYFENNHLQSYSHINPEYILEYSYDDDNRYYINPAHVWVTLCDTINAVDIIINPENFYMNLVNCGLQNRRLVKSVKWPEQLGIGWQAPFSKYHYKLNNKGLVIEKNEAFYPHHRYVDGLKEDEIEHYITYYEYIFQ